MMTVHKIGGDDAVGYSAYLASREDMSQRGDYYLSPADEQVEGIGQWHGRAAAELGLVGGVTREQLLRVWEGKDPRTGEILIRRSARGEHVAAVDCTFSAPKSVSVVWALSDEPHRGIPHQETRHRSTVISTVTTALHPYAGHILDEAAAAKESDLSLIHI